MSGEKFLAFAIIATITVSIAHLIGRWIVWQTAIRTFGGTVSFRRKRYGKYGSMHGFAFYEGDESIGWRTCLLTLIYYAIVIPLAVFLLTQVGFRISELLFAGR